MGSRRSHDKGARARTGPGRQRKGPEVFTSRADARAAGPAARSRPRKRAEEPRKHSEETRADASPPRPRGAGPERGQSRARAASGRPGTAQKAEGRAGPSRSGQDRTRSKKPADAPARDRQMPAPPALRPSAFARPRAGRASRGLWLYGRHAILAALANPQRSCHRLLGTADALARLGPQARRPGLEVVEVEREELERRFGPDAVHQGLALSVAPLPKADLERACAPEPGRNLVLVLDQITDPHNLGAILRSAAAFEARAVVVPERRSAELGGAAARAASGALDLVPVVEVTNLARALDQLAEFGYWRLGLDGQAEQTIDHAPEAENLALVLGAEGSGLRRLVAEHCDLSVSLPIAPAMESLNVSVAAGIALYALARRNAVQ